MIETYYAIGFLVGIFIASVSLLKLRRQTISQGTFTLWIVVGIIIIVICSIPSIIYIIQRILGTQFTLSAIFGLSFTFLIILVFYLHQKVDSLNQRITKLVAELASKKFFQTKDLDDE